MINPVVHFEIFGKAGKRLQDFYRQAFDWNIEVDESMGGYGMVEAKGENQIGGGICEGPEGQHGITIYIQVDDLQKYLDRAVAQGGKMILPPTKVSDQIGHVALFADPDGNVLGLFKPNR